MMTPAELDALPVTISLATACRALGVGRNQGYRLLHEGQFPVRVLTLCGRHKVSKWDLLAYLHAPGYAPADESAGDDAASSHAPLHTVPGGRATA